MEEQIIKTEIESNEEILLFYVDENADRNVGETIENMVTEEMPILDISYADNNVTYIEGTETSHNLVLPKKPARLCASRERWTEQETRKLLQFYIDHKSKFINGSTPKKDLWKLASKTALKGKPQNACEMKMRNIKSKYLIRRIREAQKKDVSSSWPCYQLCHQAFHDDPVVRASMKGFESQTGPYVGQNKTKDILVVKKVNAKRSTADGKVETMLQLYLNYKNTLNHNWPRSMWETIASELGEDDPDYWHKRFLNYKQHYLGLLQKRDQKGPNSVNWPYMQLFDQIFDGDEEFIKKYRAKPKPASINIYKSNSDIKKEPIYDWNYTELTVLVKYYYDCFNEFQDPTVPNNFLWKEVGHLLDKSPGDCRIKFNDLKNSHMENNNDGSYDIKNRIPLAIILDNIISKEVEVTLAKTESNESMRELKMSEIDELVHFMYDNVDLLKDPVCHNVAWARLSRKLCLSIANCLEQWAKLKTLYKNILSDKKENPDMEIDWRYIDMFDRIFDYGMDQTLLEETDIFLSNASAKMDSNDSKQFELKHETDNQSDVDGDGSTDDKEYSLKPTRPNGDPKAFAILNYYLRNKAKFSSTFRRKSALWTVIGKKIGMTGEQCAHRFRNLKQVYMVYLQRERKSPEKPIFWPYYKLCKKVFGYQDLLNNIEAGQDKPPNSNTIWNHEDTTKLLAHYCENFTEINNNANNKKLWSKVAKELGKTQKSCYKKFAELRKVYAKLKIREKIEPNKASWVFYDTFENIYKTHNEVFYDDIISFEESMSSDNLDEFQIYQEVPMDEDLKRDLQEDDDVQCIIVIPEGQELSDITHLESNHDLVEPTKNTEDPNEVVPETKTITRWTKRSKKKLLIYYLNYLRSHRNKEINSTDMWKEISAKLPNKTPLSCRKVFAKLKNGRLNLSDEEVKTRTPYYAVLEKILAIKPKFVKKTDGVSLKKVKGFSDVPLPKQKVQQMLEYFSMHIEEFLSPKFNKKKAWLELAHVVGEPVTKVHNKIMYLRNLSNNDDSGGNLIEEISFLEILQKISDKEKILKETVNKEMSIRDEKIIHDNEDSWNDDEVEKLLIWYLDNLEKFKNPKYVRCYLWQEASSLLQKSPLVCSKKMIEIRTEYRNKVKDRPDQLEDWRFYELCQKIYGTGKKAIEQTNLDV